MLTCVCCGQYRIEQVLLDRLRGAGPRLRYRLVRTVPGVGRYVIAETATLDELVPELDRRSILIEPADGCE